MTDNARYGAVDHGHPLVIHTTTITPTTRLRGYWRPDGSWGLRLETGHVWPDGAWRPW